MNPFILENYNFDLPAELIASTAVEPRDQSRLLVVDRKTGQFAHRKFCDLTEYLQKGDCLALNNTRVRRARLLGRRMPRSDEGAAAPLGGEVECLLLDRQPEGDANVFETLFSSTARTFPGYRFQVESEAVDGRPLIGELISTPATSGTGVFVVRFDRDPETPGYGVVPLPPYIDRKATAADESRYNTVYARSEATSAAAPTAGLHFTPELLSRLREQGVTQAELTLHVGIGTFRPVKVTDIREHILHAESFEVSADAARMLTDAKHQGGRVICVGTTSFRTLETVRIGPKAVSAQSGVSAHYIYPGSQADFFSDALITNFHLPKSSLLLLVAAFAGQDLMREAYRVAVAERYRFYSFGDAMLIL